MECVDFGNIKHTKGFAGEGPISYPEIDGLILRWEKLKEGNIYLSFEYNIGHALVVLSFVRPVIGI